MKWFLILEIRYHLPTLLRFSTERFYHQLTFAALSEAIVASTEIEYSDGIGASAKNVEAIIMPEIYSTFNLLQMFYLTKTLI